MANRLLIHAAAAALALCAGAFGAGGEAAAQTPCVSLDPPCTNQAPFVTLDPYGGTHASPHASVTVSVHDESGISPGSFVARLNGVVIQSGGPTAGARYSVQLGLTLVPGQNTLEIEVCDVQGLCDGNGGTYWYVVPPAPDSFAVPEVSLESHNEGVRALSPFDAVAAYSTPAYVSMDAPRSLTVVYSSGQALARAFVRVDAVDRSIVPPSRISLQVFDQWGSAVTAETFHQAGSGANHLAAYWFAPHLQSGAHTYQAVVRTYWDRPGGTMVRQAPARPVRVLLLNEQQNMFGRGWNLAGHQRLHFRGDSVMVSNGDGSAVFFRRTGPTTFAQPNGEWSEMTRPDSLYRRRWPDGTVAVFSANGRLKSVADRFGRTSTYGYDAAGRLTGIVDPAGKQVALAYHGPYQLASITTPGGRATLVGYNGDKVSQVIAPDWVPELNATYDAAGRTATRSDRNGGTYAFAYDAAGFVTADTLVAVAVEGGGTQRPVVRYAGWESGLLAPPGTGTAASPAPRVDTLALRARITDPRGATTKVKFDRFLLPTRVEEPLGDTTLVFRNQHGQPTSVHLPTGAFTQYQYGEHYLDSRPAPTLIWESDGDPDADNEITTTIEYETTYGLPRVVSRGGLATVYAYGGQGQLDSVSSAGYTIRYGYTPDWRTAWVDDPSGRRTSFRYDSIGFRNLREVNDIDGMGLGSRVDYTSDAHGRTATVTTPSGTVQHRYDLLNRDTAVVDPSGTTRFAYQGSFLWRVTDAAGKQYTYNRNALGWLQSRVHPGGAAAGYGYDVAGNTVRATDRRGLSATFTHDSLGRVLTRTADGATTTYAYGVGALPFGVATRWVSATSAVSTDTIHLDERGRTVEERAILWGVPNGAFRRGSTWYDEGPRRSLSYNVPGGAFGGIEFEYDGGVQLKRIRTFGAWNELAYNGVGQVDTIRIRPGTTPGPVATFEYSSDHMPSRARWSVGALEAKFGGHFYWSGLGELIMRENAAQSSQRRYGYDAMGRLLSDTSYIQTLGEMVCEDPMQPSTCFRPMDWTPSFSSAYTYDAVGNRTNAGATLQPNSNRYQTFRGYTFEYDAEGNLTRKYNASYDQTLTWNTLGQLSSVTTNGVTVTYGYNGFGQRVKRTTGGSSLYSVYDGDDLLMEVSGSGALVREYAHYPGIDQPHSMKDALGNVYYYAMEYPGHVKGLFNTSSQVVNEYGYDPWGEMGVLTENVQQPLRYMARELDPITGLYYVRNRWYDPVANRFVSEDPIGLAGGINTYAYVGNSPTNLRDPLGLFAEDGDQCEELSQFIANVKDRPAFIEACRSMTSKTFALSPLVATARPWQFSTPREGTTFTNFGPGVPSYNYSNVRFSETVMGRRAAGGHSEESLQKKARYEFERKRYWQCMNAEMAGKLGTEAAWELTWATGGAVLFYLGEKSVAGAIRGGVYGAAFGIAKEAVEINVGAS